MIRSCRIPPILNRILDQNVVGDNNNRNGDDCCLVAAMLVSADGELLGSSTSATGSGNGNNNTSTTTFISPTTGDKESLSNLGTLIADIAVDYQRLGEEYAQIENTTTTNTAAGESSSGGANKKSSSHLQTLILELDQGLVGVSGVAGMDCFVIGLASSPDAPQGRIKAKLQALAEHVAEALSPLVAQPPEASATYR